MPMQPMQPAWWMRAPAAISLQEVALGVERLEHLARRRVDVERDAGRGSARPSTISAAIAKSR